MGKYKDLWGAILKDGTSDPKPEKPRGDGYGKKAGYYEWKNWRQEKNEWKGRQNTREREAGDRSTYHPGTRTWRASN